jgi:hypothetical protein
MALRAHCGEPTHEFKNKYLRGKGVTLAWIQNCKRGNCSWRPQFERNQDGQVCVLLVLRCLSLAWKPADQQN